MSYESCVIFEGFAQNSSATEVRLTCVDDYDFIPMCCFSAFVNRLVLALEKKARLVANDSEILDLNRFKLPCEKHQRYDK